MKLPLLALCLVCSFLYVYNLHTRDFWAPDEGDFAQIACELDNDLIVPHLNEKPYGEKPPLFYYLIYGSRKLLSGVKDEFSMRLPTSLIAIGCALFFLITITSFFGKKAGVISTTILATSPLYYWQARYLQVDMVFAVFTVCSMLSFFWHEERKKRIFSYLFFMCAALAFMTKGPLSVVLIFPISGIYLAAKRDFSIFRRQETYIGLAIFSAIILPWYLAVYFREGFPYFHENIIRQNFVRFFDAWSHNRPIWYYFTTLPLDFFPWSIFFPMGIWLFVKKLSSDHRVRFFFIWFAWMFFFFSLSSGKISKYMLPLLPPMSLAVSNLFTEKESRYRTGAFIFMALVFLAVASVLILYNPGLYPQFYAYRIAIGVLSAILALGIFLFLMKKRPAYALVAVSVFMIAVYGIANMSIYEKWNPLKSPRLIAEKIRPFLEDGTPWVYYGSMRGVYVYYIGSPAIHVDEHDTAKLSSLPCTIPRFFILSRKRDLKEITDGLPNARQVFEERVGNTPMVLVEYGG